MMPHSLDQILPSLQSMGSLGYWLIGLASALEAFFITGIVVPGTLIVDAGGILVQRGALHFFDLTWFVAIGSVIGSEASYWTGRLAAGRIPLVQRMQRGKVFARAERLFQRWGGAALIIGRFLGPVAGLVPLAAAMAGMPRRRFLIWSLVGALPYAVSHLALGYVLGDVAGRLGSTLGRVGLLAATVLVLLALLWGLLHALVRFGPPTLIAVERGMERLRDRPGPRRWLARHPRLSDWTIARFDRTHFTGLPLTTLALIFIYVIGLWVDQLAGMLADDPMLALDKRLAELIYHFQSPVPIRIAAHVTALGGWDVVWPLMLGAVIWFWLDRRPALALSLILSVLGSSVTVSLMKLAFHRPRSPLGHFAESSMSFPSGHAAASVAFYGMICYGLWRSRRLRAETATLVAGILAFVIGLSRLYLIEHYLSDVLNGWLVGLLWLLVAITTAEWLALLRPATPERARWMRAASLALMLVAGLFALDNIARYSRPLNPELPQTAELHIPDVQALAHAADFPSLTETLLGRPSDPVSVIVLAPDAAALRSALSTQGWSAPSHLSPRLIAEAMIAGIRGQEDPAAQIVSQFWRGQPNDIAMRLKSARSGDAEDWQLRIWSSEYLLPGGLHVFAASVSGLGDVRAGRDAARQATARARLLLDLRAAGAVALNAVTLPGAAAPSAVLRLPAPS